MMKRMFLFIALAIVGLFALMGTQSYGVTPLGASADNVPYVSSDVTASGIAKTSEDASIGAGVGYGLTADSLLHIALFAIGIVLGFVGSGVMRRDAYGPGLMKRTASWYRDLRLNGNAVDLGRSTGVMAG